MTVVYVFKVLLCSLLVGYYFSCSAKLYWFTWPIFFPLSLMNNSDYFAVIIEAVINNNVYFEIKSEDKLLV